MLITEQLLSNISHIEFQNNLSNTVGPDTCYRQKQEQTSTPFKASFINL
jgi:hypothetical protein